MNDIVIEIKLVEKVMGLLQVHEVPEKAHIYDLGEEKMEKMEKRVILE